MNVTKANGTRQPFDKNKIISTCIRMGASRRAAESIAETVETRVYEGIETRKILTIIRRQLCKYVPSIRCHIDLRRALSLMKPKPDFERFVRLLLKEQCYEVTPTRIIKGKCVEHEVDAIASKDGKTFIVEVKHHSNYHTPTGLDVGRIARAVFEDVTEGFAAGMNSLKIDGTIIVCNTKLSEHAKAYAECRGILHFGWKSPPDQGLRTIIERKKLYPLTFLKDLNVGTRRKFETAGIILLRELVKERIEDLSERTRLPKSALGKIIRDAREILSKK